MPELTKKCLPDAQRSTERCMLQAGTSHLISHRLVALHRHLQPASRASSLRTMASKTYTLYTQASTAAEVQSYDACTPTA